jgi:hypothetical protein
MSDSPTAPVESQQPEQRTPTEVVNVADVMALMRRHRVRFAALAAAIVVLVTTIGYITTSREPYYETEALVIATELEIRIESLPRTAVAIFNAGTVATKAAQLAGTGIDPDDLIPGIVQVNPLENTGVIEITAQHPDPELAALYANSAGAALAGEMNLVGPGLGTFSLQIPAPVPTETIEPSILPILAISLVAAAVLVVGVAALTAMLSKDRTLQQAVEQKPAAAEQQPTAEPPPAPGATAPTIAPVHVDKVWAELRQPIPKSESDGKAASRMEPDGRTTKKKQKPGEDDLNELQVDELEPFVHHLDRIPRPAPVHPLASSAEQAYALMESISGVGPVFGARLAALGITKVSELAAADPKWVADAVEVRREVVIDWIRQAIGLHSELHDDTGDTGDADEAEAEEG